MRAKTISGNTHYECFSEHSSSPLSESYHMAFWIHRKLTLHRQVYIIHAAMPSAFCVQHYVVEIFPC